jgi:hypothetical protein
MFSLASLGFSQTTISNYSSTGSSGNQQTFSAQFSTVANGPVVDSLARADGTSITLRGAGETVGPGQAKVTANGTGITIEFGDTIPVGEVISINVKHTGTSPSMSNKKWKRKNAGAPLPV